MIQDRHGVLRRVLNTLICAGLGACCLFVRAPAPVVAPPHEPEPEAVNWIVVRPAPPEPEAVRFIEPELLPDPVQYVYTPLPEPVPEEILPDPEPVQIIDSPPGPRISRNDRITLIPKANGSVGAVVVRQSGMTVLLDKAYASAHIQGEGLVSEEVLTPRQIEEEFADALAALPARPEKFLLYFLEGKDLLTVESNLEVGKIIADLSARPAPEISVIGHTDSMGGREFNDRLSLQRAERVRKMLLERGIPESVISIAGRGERELLVPTEDGVAEAGNRRVEINVK